MIQATPKRTGLKRRLALLLLAVSGLAYALGMVAFVGTLERKRTEAKGADAIVALTGGGARLTTAMELLANGRGKRLLISGVHDDVTRDQLFEKVGGPRKIFDCCVDLGHGADNTIGNAHEAAEWVKHNKYKSIILVTAAYHMPRSQMEMAAAMPQVHIVEQAVFPEHLDTGQWWNDRLSAWVLLGEYTKYLLSWARLSTLEPVGLDFSGVTVQRIDYGEAEPGHEPAELFDGTRGPGT